MSRFTDVSHYGSYEEPMNLQPVEENYGYTYDEEEEDKMRLKKISKLNKTTKPLNEWGFNIPDIGDRASKETVESNLAFRKYLAKRMKKESQEIIDELERV